MFARHQLAMASNQRQEAMFARHGEQLTCEASKVGQNPQDDVAETQWGRKLCSPWRATQLARRVDADGKSL